MSETMLEMVEEGLKQDLKEKIVRFILNYRFRLRQKGLPRSKWRKKIADSYMLQEWCPGGDMFAEEWEWLDRQGLI